MSIVTRIFALFAFALVLVAGGELFNGLKLREDRLRDVRSATEARARLAALDMGRILEGAHQVLATLAKVPAEEGWTNMACSLLEATASSDFEYDHIVAVDELGHIVCSSNKTALAGQPMSDLPLLVRIKETKAFSVGSYGAGRVSNSELIRVGYPVVDRQGAVIGALYAGINLTWLNTAVTQWRLGDNISIDITDRYGTLIARHPDPSGVGRQIAPHLKSLVNAPHPGIVEASIDDGEKRLVGYVPAGSDPSAGIAVFVGRTYSSAVGGINRAILLGILATLGGFTIVVVFAVSYVHAFLARPFNNLLATAARWRAGDWSARAGKPTGISEFDRLSSAFDVMATEVSQRDRSLRYSDSILHALTESAAELVTTDKLDDAIPRILQKVGKAVEAERILILEQPANRSLNLRYAWHSPTATIQLGPSDFAGVAFPYPYELAAWVAPLARGEIVCASRHQVHGAVAALFDQLAIRSNLQAPIVVEGKHWGALAVDDCRTEREWAKSEIDAIRVLADLIGATIARAQQLERISNADEVVRNSPTVLYRLGPSDKQLPLIYVSDNVSAWGYNAASLMADPAHYFSLIHPDDRTTVEAALSAINSGNTGATVEFRLARPDGGWRWLENRYTPVRNAQGDLVEIGGVLVDISERKLAQENLQFANTLLISQKETSPDGILVVDNDGKVISSNQRLLDIWQLPQSVTQAGRDDGLLQDILPKVKDADTFQERVRFLYSHPTEVAHDEIELKDGRFLDRHSGPLRTSGGQSLGRIWFFRDITERKRAENALAESEVRFRTILEATGDGIAVIDPESHQFILGNQALCQLLGLSVAELMSLDIEHAYEPAEVKPAIDRIREAVSGHSSLGLGIRMRRKDGSKFVADVMGSRMSLGKKNYVVAVYRDITERERMQSELQRERDFSATLIDRLPGIFFVLDSKGRNVRVNSGVADATGRSVSDLLGADALQHIAPNDRGPAAKELAAALEPGSPPVGIELDVLHASGSSRRYLIHGVQLMLDDGPGFMGIGVDVTEARSMERLLRESEQRFRAIFASVSDGIFVHESESGRLIEANQSICDMFGYTREEILRCDIGDLSSGSENYNKREAVRRFAAARSGRTQVFEWQARAKSGRTFFVEVTLRKVAFGDREFLLSTAHDITERKHAEERILQMARFDSLTGLANRTVFTDALQKAIADVDRGGEGFAVLYLDLDHFKDINDTLGHPTGDALLKLVAERLRSTARDIDTLARFGGDEFAVLQAGVSDPTEAGLLAERLLQVLSPPFVIDENEIRAAASIGIAVFGPDATNAETLLSHADVALYRAKSEERGTYRFFTTEMSDEVRFRVSIGNDLRNALTSDQLFLEYQPQIDSATGRIVGVEALLRWRHPTRGLLSPSEFISIAERNGMVAQLGRWVLRDACRQAQEWRRAGLPVTSMAVNISAPQFKASQSLEADINQALDEFGLPASVLELELTESVLMDASRHHNDLLVRLRQAGIRLAVDDFGTGYSSLDYLRRFPVDRIKIAQVFILDLEAKAENGIIVRAAISLARALSISVLAEGVETATQLDLLRTWGCSIVQGFYFSRPLSATAMAELLSVGTVKLDSAVSA